MSSEILDLNIGDLVSPIGFGSQPGCAIALSCPTDTIDTYYQQTTVGIATTNSGKHSGGFSDMVGEVTMARASAWYQTLGIRGDGGQCWAANTGITSGSGSFFESTGQTFGQIFRICPDEAAYDGHGAGDPDGPTAILLMGNQCEAKTGFFIMQATTGNQSITGVGFQPDVVLFLGCFQQDINHERSGDNFMIGAADAAGNQWVGAVRSDFGSGIPAVFGGTQGPTKRWSRWFNDNCITHIASPMFSGPTTVDQLASLVSMDADGFTINLTQAGLDSGGEPSAVMFMALKAFPGGSLSVGNGTQGDATLAAGFAPDALLMASTQNPNSGGMDRIDSYLSMGVTDGVKERNFWAGSDYGGPANFSPPDSWAYTSTVSTLRLADITLTTLAECSVALTGTGANLTWSTDDGGARLFGWVAFKLDGISHVPVVVTDPPTGITSTGVVLNGTITPNSDIGTDVDFYFEWGISPFYGLVTPTLPAGDGYSPVAVSSMLTPVAPGVYHYRVVAVDQFGCEYPGNDETFEIPRGGWKQIRYR